MVHFRKLVLHNFMSYRGKTVIRLANQGIVQIEGSNEDDQTADSNMAGKSTIVEALLWCLFGRTLRGLKHGQVVNRKARKNCFVGTTFTASGKRYSYYRYRKHWKHGNKLVLTRGNIPISSRHSDDTQTRLENILDCDYDSFVNSVVFGGFDSGTRKQFALQTDAQQKQLLDSFLKFEKFEIALRRAKHEISKSREKSQQLQIEVERQRGKSSSAKVQIESLTDSLRNYKQEQKRERQDILRKMQALPEIEKGSHKEIRHCSASVEKYIERKAAIRHRLSHVSRQLRLLAEKRLNREKLIGKPCPTCGQEIHSLTSILKHFKRDKIRLKAEKQVAVKALHKVERRLTDGRKELGRLQKLKQLDDSHRLRKAQLEERLAELQRRSSSVFQEELEKASKQYARQVSKLLALKYEEHKLQKRIQDLEFWEKGFGNKGVKALIVREALPAMNAKLKEYASEIFESDVELEFRPSKETKKGDERELFNVHYRTRRNADNYTAESSGGRRRIDICLLLVFSWFARTADCLFVDELLDGLDSSGRERVLEILSKQRGSVFVISHSRELKSRLGTVWTVTKRKGISRLRVPDG